MRDALNDSSIESARGIERRPAARVLFVDHTSELGGAEIGLLNLAQALDRERYEPVVVLFSDGPLRQRLVAADVETHVIGSRDSLVRARKDTLGLGALSRVGDVLAMLWLVLKLRNFIRRSNVQVVHAHSLKADIIGGLAGRLAGKPVIWHVHDRIASDYLPAPVARVFRWLARIVPHKVACNSKATLKTLCRDCGESGSGRYQVIHCGTIVPVQSPAMEPRGESPLIGLVGRISHWKGQDVFLKAAAIAHQRFPLARFQVIGGVLFGEQEYEQQLHDSARELGLNDVVEFTGFRSDVPDLIRRLDVLVHASTAPEPFGQVVIEGMVAGKPVVATDGGGIPEIVVDGVTGLLVPMGDVQAMAAAIESLLSNPASAAELGRHGRQRVLEHFTIGHVAAKFQTLYGELIARARASLVEARSVDKDRASEGFAHGTGAG
jgi:glycosyltransferase involved in cell wall biosynthesis